MGRGGVAVAGVAVAGLAALGLLVIGLRRQIAVVTVEGDSMWPALAPGDRVIVHRGGTRRLRRGQVVVVEQPGTDGRWPGARGGPPGRRLWAIKRVAALPGDPRPRSCPPATPDSPEHLVPPGKLVLLGDNPEWSHDSRQLGYFPVERLLGVVVRQLA